MLKIPTPPPYIIALLIASALVLWLLSGQTKETITPVQISSSKPIIKQPLKVQVKVLKAEPLQRKITLTGRTAPYRMTTLRAEIDARVVAINTERGKRVKKGTLLLRLATDERQLLVKEAQANLKQHQINYKAMKNLSKKGYQSEVKIAEVFALLENARTVLKRAELDLQHTKIYAPFESILIERHVEIGDYVTAGMPIAEVMDEDPFLIIADISELQRPYVKLGQAVTAQLVTGQMIRGKVSLISHQANKATRTFSIEIEVANPKRILSAGITTGIEIPIENIMAHKVSASLLSLNDDGVLGIKAVDEQNQVVFYPIKLAQSSSEGIWLRDLPETLHFIAVGQGFVREGDIVEPILTE
ncbi:efflux RND transporter periplasmic adaptor subunit [Candidatus Albibeggiatoa sp. nov. BB20]|uniref:efflux RND transporter periplasmic adaptor subunit n=1 Tax=Candidatus Albibeggiatoa sp. nov. BB20 TaxID=3162723 RepID=UPI003365904C